MRLLWLADVLRDAGLQVVEVDGWQSRGRELDIAYGVVVHDTVTTAGWTDQAVDSLLANGKPGTPGPLSQLGVDRRGRFRIIASGRANHAGYSKPWGNSSVGIEVYCAGGLKGREEPWNDAQYEAVTVGAGAILDRLALGPSEHFNPRVAGHKEIDTRGKIDPYGIDMAGLRRDVVRPIEKGRTVTSKRIAGEDRHATAAMLAYTGWPTEQHQGGVVFLLATGSADGDAVGNVAANGPVLTVEADKLPAATADALAAYRPAEVVAIGGSAVVSDRVVEQARRAAAS